MLDAQDRKRVEYFLLYRNVLNVTLYGGEYMVGSEVDDKATMDEA